MLAKSMSPCAHDLFAVFTQNLGTIALSHKNHVGFITFSKKKKKKKASLNAH